MPDGACVSADGAGVSVDLYITHNMLHKVKHWRNDLIAPVPLYRMDGMKIVAWKVMCLWMIVCGKIHNIQMSFNYYGNKDRKQYF